MGSGVSKTEQVKANRQLQAQLQSLQTQVKRLQISSTTILKDDDFGEGTCAVCMLFLFISF